MFFSLNQKEFLILKFLGNIKHWMSHKGDMNLRCVRAFALAVAVTLDK